MQRKSEIIANSYFRRKSNQTIFNQIAKSIQFKIESGMYVKKSMANDGWKANKQTQN